MGLFLFKIGIAMVKRKKNDEFYTQYCDIEKECSNYLEHFFNKIIYCNTDTVNSNFVKYFQNLKQQRIIKDIWYTGGLGGLDFRSQQSIDLLKHADIVVSNPPFSLFREYVSQLIKYDKKFLIIGPTNAIAYDEVFVNIKDNKLWNGTRPLGGPISMIFDVPNQMELTQSGKHYVIINGVAKAQIPSTWFTNLEHDKHRPLILSKRYKGNEVNYPKYDNFDAININRKNNIPYDYYGVMGVPITFIDRYNPEQFKILGRDKDLTNNKKGLYINGRLLYTRILIQRNTDTVANDNQALTRKAA